MLLTPETESTYVPFIINDIFSRYVDSIYAAEEMNRRPNIPKEMQYRYLMNSMRKANRFSKMPKFEKPYGFDAIQEFYKYNNRQTQEVLDILAPEEIQSIIDRIDKGGLRKK